MFSFIQKTLAIILNVATINCKFWPNKILRKYFFGHKIKYFESFLQNKRNLRDNSKAIDENKLINSNFRRMSFKDRIKH